MSEDVEMKSESLLTSCLPVTNQQNFRQQEPVLEDRSRNHHSPDKASSVEDGYVTLQQASILSEPQSDGHPDLEREGLDKFVSTSNEELHAFCGASVPADLCTVVHKDPDIALAFKTLRLAEVAYAAANATLAKLAKSNPTKKSKGAPWKGNQQRAQQKATMESDFLTRRQKHDPKYTLPWAGGDALTCRTTGNTSKLLYMVLKDHATNKVIAIEETAEPESFFGLIRIRTLPGKRHLFEAGMFPSVDHKRRQGHHKEAKSLKEVWETAGWIEQACASEGDSVVFVYDHAKYLHCKEKHARHRGGAVDPAATGR